MNSLQMQIFDLIKQELKRRNIKSWIIIIGLVSGGCNKCWAVDKSEYKRMTNSDIGANCELVCSGEEDYYACQ